MAKLSSIYQYTLLVEFFAPRCGHCEVLTPIWEKAATVLKGVVTVAALDADAHKFLAQEYGIRGFPTIKAFSPGKPPVDYQGARDLKAITEFAIQQTSTLAILAALAPSPSPSPPSPSFNHYVRVEQWALGVCKDPKIKCISTTLPKIFTVHGLWPITTIFAIHQINILTPMLTIPWPSVTTTMNNDQFWKHEWRKHGTCSTFQKIDYFQHGVNLWARENITAILEQAGITPGKSYDQTRIITAINAKTGSDPELVCVAAGNYLAEIRLCLDPSTATTYMVCPTSINKKPSCQPMVAFAA